LFRRSGIEDGTADGSGMHIRGISPADTSTSGTSGTGNELTQHPAASAAGFLLGNTIEGSGQ